MMAIDSTTRQAVLVLGMHRSGTSALARLLNLLGVKLGENLLPAAADNEMGFWEHRQIQYIHDRVYETLGRDWTNVSSLPPRWWEGQEIDPYRTQLREELERDLGDAALWGVKDPRLCSMLPLWKPLLVDDLHSRAHCILIFRNPAEVARSLGKRDQMAASRAYLLWLRSMIDSERDSRGLRRTITTYNLVLSDWRGQVERMGRDLGIDWPVEVEAVAAAIDDFLRPSVRHYQVNNEVFLKDETVPEIVRRAYAAVLKAAESGEIDSLTETADQIAADLDECQPLLSRFIEDFEQEHRSKVIENNVAISSMQYDLAVAQNTAAEKAAIETHARQLTDELAAKKEALATMTEQKSGIELHAKQLAAELAAKVDALAVATERKSAIETHASQLNDELKAKMEALAIISEQKAGMELHAAQLAVQVDAKTSALTIHIEQLNAAKMQISQLEQEIQQLRETAVMNRNTMVAKDHELDQYRMQRQILLDVAGQAWRSQSWRWTALLRRRTGVRLTADQLKPASAMEKLADNGWRAAGPAQFILPCLPVSGLISIRLKMKSNVSTRARLYFDSGRLFNLEQSLDLGAVDGAGKEMRCTHVLAAPVHCFRLDPVEEPGEFVIEEFEIMARPAPFNQG